MFITLLITGSTVSNPFPAMSVYWVLVFNLSSFGFKERFAVLAIKFVFHSLPAASTAGLLGRKRKVYFLANFIDNI